MEYRPKGSQGRSRESTEQAAAEPRAVVAWMWGREGIDPVTGRTGELPLVEMQEEKVWHPFWFLFSLLCFEWVLQVHKDLKLKAFKKSGTTSHQSGPNLGLSELT